MNIYETIVIINPSLTDEDTQAAIDRVKSVITDGGGEVLKVDNWGRKKLAYEINRQTRGSYVLYLMKAPSSLIKKLEDLFRVYDPIFKYMVTKLEKKQKEAALRSIEEKVPEPEAAPAEETAKAEEQTPQAAEEAPAQGDTEG